VWLSWTYNGLAMASVETPAHHALKRLAITWARDHRFSAIATEVRLSRSAFRADVASYKTGTRGVLGTTAVFECKQARSDFLKDSYRQDATRARLQALDQRRRKLEELLKLHLPSLWRGEMLFAEFDAIHLAGYENKTYRRVLREMETLQRRLAGKTKFDRLVRYRCGNLNYLVVEPGILAPEETPVGWGVLVRQPVVGRVPSHGAVSGDTTHNGELILQREPIWHDVTEADRLALLQNIAAAATRHALADL
jgi:hypothetical protein